MAQDDDSLADKGFQRKKSIAETVSDAKQKLQRKQTAIRADRRAKARRIESEQPETLSERVAVSKRKAKQTADELGGLASEATDTAALQLGFNDAGDEGDDGGLLGGALNALDEATKNAAEADLSEPVLDDGEMTNPMNGDKDEPMAEGMGFDDPAPLDPVDGDPLEAEDDDLDDLDPL